MLDKIYNYSGVLFTQKDISSLKSFCNFINCNAVSEPEVLDKGDKSGLLIAKFNYLSSTQFFRNPQLAEELNKPYEYSFYYFSFKIEDEYFSIVAFPWIKMGVELFKNIRPKNPALDSMLKYHQIDLGKMIKSLKSEFDNNITLETAELKVEGQSSNIKSLTISGERPLITSLFNAIDELVEYEPKKVKLVHSIQNSRDFRVTFDNYGNFQFRIGADTSVLENFKSVFSILSSRNLLEIIDGYYNPMNLKLNLKEEDD